MGTVVNSEATPSINRVNCLDGIVLQRGICGRQPLVVTSGTVDKIPRSGRVIKALWIRDTICNRRHPLIEVFVTKKSNIDPILKEDGLKSCLARVALGIINVPRAMAGNNDPGCLLAVDGSQVFLQPLKLRAVRRKGTGVLLGASTRKVWGIRELKESAGGFRSVYIH